MRAWGAQLDHAAEKDSLHIGWSGRFANGEAGADGSRERRQPAIASRAIQTAIEIFLPLQRMQRLMDKASRRFEPPA